MTINRGIQENALMQGLTPSGLRTKFAEERIVMCKK